MARNSRERHRDLETHRRAFRESFVKAEASNTRAAITIGRHAVA